MELPHDFKKKLTALIREQIDQAIDIIIPEVKQTYKTMFNQIVAQFYDSYPPRRYKRHDGGGNFANAFVFDYTNTDKEFQTPDDISGYIDASAIKPHFSVTGSDNYSEEGIIMFALSVGQHSNFPWIVAIGGERPQWNAQLSLPKIGQTDKMNPAAAWKVMDDKIGKYYEDRISNEAAELILENIESII